MYHLLMQTIVVRARLLAALLFILTVIITPGTVSLPPRALALAVSPTGFNIAPRFKRFYDEHGGLTTLGFAVGEPRIENGLLVQWTERQRLEWHPELAGSDNEVLLGLLGRELTHDLNGPRFQPDASLNPQANAVDLFFPETGQHVSEPFASYWKERGGLTIFGFPISTRYKEDSGLEVQWFERARFEFHPELDAPFTVLLGHVGLEALKQRGKPSYEFEIAASPVNDSPFKIDIAQGGESADPRFLDDVRQPGADLGPGLVRVDNIFSFYNIVQRGPDGNIRYNWVDLDRMLDGILAMDKKPLICLSYMPEAISRNGLSRVLPPAHSSEWYDLVKATVKHVNIERKLGVRYWEVWNEPNQWSFWQGSYPDYLELYDTTVQAATAADPTVLIGGPALSSFSTGHLQEFFAHEVSLGSLGKIDFISWHAYGERPADLATEIQEARRISAQYPKFRPELFVTEFNVLQAAGDTSANSYTDKVQGAISLLSTIEVMQRERLDRAFLFELKDGQGPARFWGRWGILTNDGVAKPIYHVLKAYRQRPPGMLPVRTVGDAPGGKVGLMAFRGSSRASFMLWYSGDVRATVKIRLPTSLAAQQFDLTLFDKDDNNPAATGDARLMSLPPRSGGDLALDLEPDSVVLINSR